MSSKSKVPQGKKNNKSPNKSPIQINTHSHRFSPSGSSGVRGGGAALSSTPPLSQGAVSSQSSTYSQLTSHFSQFKRAAGPSQDFPNWNENQWFKKLCLVIEAQITVIQSLQSENQANCANLHQQQQQITLLREEVTACQASQVQLQHDLNHLSEENTRLKSNESVTKQEEALNRMNACISSITAQQSISQDEQDQQKLLDSVIMSSTDIPAESEGEKCIDIVHAILKDHLKVQVNKPNIIAAYRVGKKNSTGPSHRKIRIKLASQSIKSDIVQSAVSSNKGIYINECLTKTRQELLYRLRQIRRQNQGVIHQCFARDGMIKVRKTSTGKMFSISNEDNLKSFLTQCGLSHLSNPSSASS